MKHSRLLIPIIASLSLIIPSTLAQASSLPSDEKIEKSKNSDSKSDNTKPKLRVMHAAEDINARNIVITNASGQKITLDGSGTAVGVLDDGLVTNHPALQKAPTNPKFAGEGKIIWGKNWAVGSDEYTNDFSRDHNPDHDQRPYHGLHVVGIIGGNGPASADQGAPEFQGIAPETQIIFHKVQSKHNPGIVKDDVMMAAIETAVAQGADVINLSLGTDSATIQSAAGIRSAIASALGKGVLTIATSGNMGYFGGNDALPLASNPDYGTIARPALAPWTISANSMTVTVKKGHAFSLTDSPDQELEFRQPEDQYYNGNRASKNKYHNDWWDYDEWYDYPLDGQEIPYIFVENPTEENLRAAEASDKFVVVSAKIPGLSNDTNNPDGYFPDYLLAAENAKKVGAKGIIVNTNSSAKYGFDILEPQLFQTKRPSGYLWDRWNEFIKYPIMAISQQSAEALKNSSTQKILFNARVHEFKAPEGLDMAGFSARGVSSDFIFKGDISTPSGGRVMSLGQRLKWNRETRQNDESLGLTRNGGTSMSAPQISGAVALIRQRLKEQYPELVEQPNGVTAYLVKNLLMSAATPQTEKHGAYKGVLFSPRAQGNGLLNVKAAALTDVVAVSPEKTDDNETGFAKTNLRQLSSHGVNFEIELRNYGYQPQSFTPYLHLLTDDVKDGRFTMHEKVLVDGKELASVTVPPRQPNAKEPGKATITVNYQLTDEKAAELKNLAPNGYFLEGYVQFEPTATASDNQPTIYHSFIGFDGDWLKPPLYDPFVYDLKDGEKPFYYDATVNRDRPRSGDLKSTHLESFVGSERRILGALPNYTKENMAVTDKHLAISPNDDGKVDSVNPVYTMLRNYESININVTNEAGEEVFKGSYGLGITDKKKNFGYYSGYVTEAPNALTWKGKDIEERTLPEGEYTYTSIVKSDLINTSNPQALKIKEGRSPEDLQEKRVFKILVDLTPPILKSTKLISEDNGNKTVKFNIEDPVLGANQVPGSGIYTAELLTPNGNQLIEFDPLNPQTLADQEFSFTEEDFEKVRIRLTDWAHNTATYRPAFTLEGMDTGYLNITSIDQETDQNLKVNYNVVDTKTGRAYPGDANIPVGTYRIQPENAPEGYEPSDRNTAEDFLVNIEKDKTAERTLYYQMRDDITSYKIYTDSEEEAEKVKASHMELKLTNLESGVVYKTSLIDDGFSGKAIQGVYQIEFLNAPKDTKPTIWSPQNTPLKVLRISINEALVSRQFTLTDEAPGEVSAIPPTVAEYLKDQTYMQVRGTAGSIPKILVYAPNDLQLANPILTISADSGVISARELPSRHGEDTSIYYYDLNKDAINTLVPGAILQPVQDQNGTEVKNSKVGVVGYNHILADQVMKYLKNKAKGTDNEEKVRKLVEDFLYNYSSPHNSAGYNLELNPGHLFERDGANPEKEGYGYPSLKTVSEENNYYYQDYLSTLEKIYEASGDRTPAPILYLHNGQFQKIYSPVYPRDHDGFKYLDQPTTAIVNDVQSVCEAQKGIFGKFTENIHGEPTIPNSECDDTAGLTAEGYDRVQVLDLLKDYVAIEGWSRGAGEEGQGDEDIVPAGDGEFRFASLGRPASYQPGKLLMKTLLKIHTYQIENGNNLPGKKLTLSGAGRSEEITTDAEGNYLVKDLLPGTYTITRDSIFHPAVASDPAVAPMGLAPRFAPRAALSATRSATGLANTDNLNAEKTSWTLTVSETGNLSIDNQAYKADEVLEIGYRMPPVPAEPETPADPDNSQPEPAQPEPGQPGPDMPNPNQPDYSEHGQNLPDDSVDRLGATGINIPLPWVLGVIATICSGIFLIAINRRKKNQSDC